MEPQMKRLTCFVLPMIMLAFFGCADQATAPEPDLFATLKKPPKPPPIPDPPEEANPFIAYESRDALWVMDEDGGNPTKILDTGPFVIPSWSPVGDGTSVPYKVLITSISTGRLPVKTVEILVNGGVPQLGTVKTLSTELNYVQARISPNGQDFVAVHVGPPEDFQGSLVFSNLETFSPRTAYLVPGHTPFQPAWNHDGSKLAFFDHEESTGAISVKIMNASTFSVVDAFLLECFPRGLSWSPVLDRDELALDCDGSIGTVILDETLPMADPPIQFLGAGISPIWSPDGTKIIYTNRDRIYVNTVGGSTRDVRLTGGMRPDWRR